MIDPAYESMLDRYKGDWERGKWDRVIPAFNLCAKVGLPFPEWLRQAVLDDLRFAYRNRQRGEAMARTGAIQDASNRKHETRHGLVQTALAQQAWALERGLRTKRLNKREAARDAFAMLMPGKEATQREIEQILESYDRVEKSAEIFENLSVSEPQRTSIRRVSPHAKQEAT